MSVIDGAPRGGVKASIGGKDYVFLLTMGAIERYEDAHTEGIYPFMQNEGVTYTKARDLLTLALVGGGMTEERAKEVSDSWTPAVLIEILTTAMLVLSAAMVPGDADEIELESAGGKVPGDSTSGGS